MNILVIDDHALFRTGLRQLLTSLSDEVSIIEAGSCQEAFGLVDDRLDLILLDLSLPDMDGFEAMDKLAELAPTTPLAIISASEDSWDIKRAMEEGAMGYISKTEDEKVILSAIHLILSGGIYVPPSYLNISQPTPHKKQHSLADRLTPRQRDVLKLLSKGKSNKEIARSLDLSETTVKTHVSALLKTCEAHNRSELIVIAQRLGIH